MALAAATPRSLVHVNGSSSREWAALVAVIEYISAARPPRSSAPDTQPQRRAEDDHRAQAAGARRRGHGLRGGRAVGGLQAPLLRSGGGVVQGRASGAGQQEREERQEHRAQATHAGRRRHGLRAVGGLQAPLLREGGRVLDGCAALAGEQEGDHCKDQAGHLLQRRGANAAKKGGGGGSFVPTAKDWAKGLSQ